MWISPYLISNGKSYGPGPRWAACSGPRWTGGGADKGHGNASLARGRLGSPVLIGGGQGGRRGQGEAGEGLTRA
jgi:hypothetical protein